MAGLMDFLNSLGGGIVGLTNAIGTPSVAGDPSAESMAGDEGIAYAQKVARTASNAAIAEAARRRVPWYMIPQARDVAGQDAYSGALDQAQRYNEVMKRRGEDDDRRARLKKLMTLGSTLLDDEGKPQFSPSQLEALQLLPESDQATIMGQQMFPNRGLERDKSMPIQVSGGYLQYDKDKADWVFHKTESDRSSSGAGGGVIDPALLEDPGVQLMGMQLLQGIKPTTRSAPVLRAVNAVAMNEGLRRGMTPAQIASAIGAGQLDFHSIQKVNDQYITTGASLAALHKHLRTVEELAGKVGGRINKPVLERWRQWIAGNYSGDADVTNFNLAYTEAKNEYMKIVSGGVNSVAGIDATARIEGDRVFPAGANMKIISGLKVTADRVATEKLKSYEDQIISFRQGQTAWGEGSAPVVPTSYSGVSSEGAPAPGVLPTLKPRPHR
jgi:hypothetical protein